MSVTTMPLKVVHQVKRFRERLQPRVIVGDLARAGLLHDYFLYESQSGARIGGNCVANVTVTADRVELEQGGVTTRSERAVDPFKQVESYLGSLPMSNWT